MFYYFHSISGIYLTFFYLILDLCHILFHSISDLCLTLFHSISNFCLTLLRTSTSLKYKLDYCGSITNPCFRFTSARNHSLISFSSEEARNPLLYIFLCIREDSPQSQVFFLSCRWRSPLPLWREIALVYTFFVLTYELCTSLFFLFYFLENL